MVVFSAIAAWVTAGFNAIFANALVAQFGFYGAAGIGMAVGQAAAAAIAIGVSRALAPRINIPVAEIQAVINQSDAPRRIYVGKNLAGGIRAFYHTKGGVLYQLVVLGHGEISRFAGFRIDGEPAAINGAGGVTSTEKAGYVTVETRDGAGAGGDYAALTSTFPLTWTAGRTLSGQATFLVQSKAPPNEDFAKVFPRAYNTLFQWVIEGQAIFDPRTDRTSYSDNAALVIAHYLTHPDGYRLALPEVDWDSVEAMADVADLPIPQKSGGAAPNLRLWGYWTLDEAPVDVLSRMHASSGIRAYETQDGKIGLIGGHFGTPACTITGKDIRSIQTKEAISEREGYNVLIPFVTLENHGFEAVELEAWRDAVRLSQEGELSAEYHMQMCPNQSQGRRLGKQQLANDNRPRIEIITNLVGLKARYPKVAGQRHSILLDYRPEDGSGRVINGEYEVLNHEFDPINLECRIELAQADRASEAWNPVEEGDLLISPPTPELDGPPPLSATLTQRIVQSGGSVRTAYVEVAAAAVSGRDDLRLEVRYREVGGGWPSWRSVIAPDLVAQTPILRDGGRYVIEARWRGVFEGVMDWQPIGTVTIIVDATPPGLASELIPSTGTGYVHLSWRNPSGSFSDLRIYRGLSGDLVDAAIVGTTGGVAGQISEYRDDSVTAPTTYYYWIVAANASGIEGPAFGPASITTI